MGEIKKGRHKIKLFNWLRGLFRREAVRVLHKPVEGVAFWTWTNADYDRSVRNGFLNLAHEREYNLRMEIARLRRNKKKHSHLQKELDALIDSGADTQTNNGDDQ